MALPSGYKRLEYIESSGTQYIDTGYLVVANTRVVCDFQITTQPSSTVCVFRISNAGTYGFGWQSDGAFRTWGGSAYTFSSDISATERHTVDKRSTVCILDDAQGTTTAHSACSVGLPLFAHNNGSAITQYCSMRLYSCQIYEGTALVRNYIPCLNSSGVVGLWDDVESVFHGNDGTGTFTAGPEYDPTTPVGDHNSLIDGVAREIEGLDVLLGGVDREIKSGIALVDGVTREISFSSGPYEVSVGWYPGGESTYSADYYSVIVGDMEAALGDILTVDEGTNVSCSVSTPNSAYSDARIYMDGVQVVKGTTLNRTYSYSFAVTSPVTIQLKTNLSGYGFTGFWIYITTS